MEINNIVKKVLLRYPLFGNIIVNLNFKFTNEPVDAPAFTDGQTIYYKEEFLTDYNDFEKEFIIAHEIFHIILSHIFRNIGKDPDLLNYVEDGIINQLLIRDGLTMPEGLVYIEDALDYSVEELYIRFLPRLKEIKKWMKENTYHLELKELSQKINEILKNSYGATLGKNNSKDLQELMSENEQIRQDLLEIYKEEMKNDAIATGYGNVAGRKELPPEPVGKSKPLVTWKDILEATLNSQEKSVTSFYEIEMDGVLRKEEKEELNYSESEIIIDSSGSMSPEILKIILRECKNILSQSEIKIGFCDVEFYGWNEIFTESAIDKIRIKGRGGTDLKKMAESFSHQVDNKIVITDGYCEFPTDRPDIIWLVINNHLPWYINPQCQPEEKLKNINVIFIDEKEIPIPNNSKSLSLKLN